MSDKPSSPDQVQAYAQTVSIPTYDIGTPNKNPMFLEKRVYQGSSGVVYPHPVIESVSDEKHDKDYTALFLENRYLKIMLLPEIGGRVQMALDKTNGYHFVYYNQVIKPALVGLTGPWISGGIEFNWPQHHRPSTFQPVEWSIQENEDGSKTVWMGEIERMFRTKGMAGFTLYPEKAYLEIKAQLYNRTDVPQTFLWWANPAVAVNDDYQSVFPPDVHAVMDHGKRDVSDFPIATGTYYKMDYSPGTDISRYKNIPVPTSYMAYHSDFDFLGSYDHGVQAGMLHVANHHLVPGKKQWTWGNGDFGQAWDRQLTDEDGPYIELMCGAFTDNQPDFSWLMPGEEKTFSQIFMPYKHIGAPKNANKDAAINLEINGTQAKPGVYLSSARQVQVILKKDEDVLFKHSATLNPEIPFTETVTLPPDTRPQQVTLAVLDGNSELISFTPLPDEKPDIPKPAQPALPPEDISTIESLYLNGLHLEQYRHATYRPEDYYREALRRDPLDSRVNNAMGVLAYKAGQFAEAEGFFRTAIESLTRRNPNPYDGEPYYNLGLALKMQARYREAYDAFYKATWNAAWQNQARLELARLASRLGRSAEAKDLLAEVLLTNCRNHAARHLQAAIFRQLGEREQARQTIETGLQLDPLSFGLAFEQSLLAGTEDYRQALGENVHNYIELALEYAQAGLFAEAHQLLEAAPLTDPMVKYYQGWFYHQQGNHANAIASFRQAAQLSPDYCFPHRIQSVPALQTAIQLNPQDARAPYYLGNFFYAHRQYEEATTLWETAQALDPQFPTVHRNLGLAYMNKQQQPEKALSMYRRAFELDPTDARVLFEYDQLLKKTGTAPEKRLQLLEEHPQLVAQRDDLTIEWITLLNLTGQHRHALQVLEIRNFHPWEGGEGKTTGQYVLTLVELAKQHLEKGEYQTAIQQLGKAQHYPHNLGEGKLVNANEHHIFYYLGLAYRGLGEEKQAQSWFQKATEGRIELKSQMYYNDQPPDIVFYQGLAYQALGQQEKAAALFQDMVQYGQNNINSPVTIDYFAVSLPDFLVFEEDIQAQNQLHCQYMAALGYLGLGQTQAARQNFEAILGTTPYHLGAVIHQGML